MDIDAATVALAILKATLAASALAAIGLALSTTLYITRDDSAKKLGRLAALAAAIAVACGGARVLMVSGSLAGDVAMTLNPESLAWAWALHQANVVALATGAVLLAGAAMRPSRAAGILGALAIAASFSAVGHVHALTRPGLAPLAVMVHVLAAGFWVVAPYTLWPSSTVSDVELAQRVERFGQFALLAVPVLFALGLWIAWRLLGGFGSIFAHSYGQLLLAKSAAASIALFLGATNKIVISKKLQADPKLGRRWLRATLSADLMLFGLAIALVTLATTITGPQE